VDLQDVRDDADAARNHVVKDGLEGGETESLEDEG
jgi:hypothetical protein